MMDYVQKHATLFAILGAVTACVVGLFVYTPFRAVIAEKVFLSGNFFFGGSPLYSVTVADQAYRLALFLDPNVSDAWHQRGRIAFLRGDFDGAKWMMDEQIALHGDSLIHSYYMRALIAGYDKRYEDAEKDFERFIEFKPYSWAAHNDLAWVYFAQGKFADAEAQASTGIYYHPFNPWLLTMRGMALYNLGRFEDARQDLETAQREASKMTEESWHSAYPGNHPALADEGLRAIKETIERNLALVNK